MSDVYNMTLMPVCLDSGSWHDQGLKPLVIVNLAANQGNAGRRWAKLALELQSMLPRNTPYFSYHPPFLLENVLDRYVRDEGCNCIISAGGDGTINHLLNLLMNLQGVETQRVFLGGIGLGSSNDFVKPVKANVDDVLCRIRPEKSLPVDIGKVRFAGTDGKQTTRYFIINASLGVTAEANLLFNRGDQVIDFLKSRMLNPAILYTAFRTILTYRNIPVSLRTKPADQGIIEELRFRLSNLSVLKNPHVSGIFYYDQDISMDDGWLGLNYCSEMSKCQMLGVLRDLAKGRFTGKPKRFSMKTKEVDVFSEEFIALEMDGEVVEAKDIHFSIAKRKINVLG